MAGATAYGPTYYTRGAVRAYWALGTPSSMLNRFDVYVDGRLYTSGRNTARVAVLRRLTPMMPQPGSPPRTASV